MKIIADLQLHSKYSRAVSQQMVIPQIWEWAKRKGIGLVATGDWTHPLWMREIKANLEEMGNGLLKLRTENTSTEFIPSEVEGLSASQELRTLDGEGPYFLLATEVSSIYSQGGKLRRIHNLIWSPSIATADKINKALIARGCNLIADGRPIIGLSSIAVAELVFSIDSKCLLIPAHAWTPWFSLFGSESGFDSIDECFGTYSRYIYAIETGLSSDPAMNWRILELDNRSIVSFSDAHSGPKLGREATVFDLEDLSYENIRKAILNVPQVSKTPKVSDALTNSTAFDTSGTSSSFGTSRIAYTIEFYPEEGKYHYSGHRNCGIKQNPAQTKQKGTTCPVCGRKLTVGVMHRVEQLAGRSEEDLKLSFSNFGDNIQMSKSDAFSRRPPYLKLVPLQEILAEAIGGLPASQNVQNEYKKLTDHFDGEFKVLLEISSGEIAKISGLRVAEGIEKVRRGDIVIDPGYDGVFGKVKIWGTENKEEKKSKEQMSLF